MAAAPPRGSGRARRRTTSVSPRSTASCAGPIPGPAAITTTLATPAQQPHLVGVLPLSQDPAAVQLTPDRVRLSGRLAAVLDDARRDVLGHASADAVHRTGSERRTTACESSTRATSFGPGTLIRLVANGTYEIHPPMQKPSPLQPVEFDMPVGGDARRRADADLHRPSRDLAAPAAATRSPRCG